MCASDISWFAIVFLLEETDSGKCLTVRKKQYKTSFAQTCKILETNYFKSFLFSQTVKKWRTNRGSQRFKWIITNKKTPRNSTNILKLISYEGRDFWKCWYDKLLYFIKSKKNQKFVSVGVYHMKVKRIKGYLLSFLLYTVQKSCERNVFEYFVFAWNRFRSMFSDYVLLPKLSAHVSSAGHTSSMRRRCFIFVEGCFAFIEFRQAWGITIYFSVFFNIYVVWYYFPIEVWIYVFLEHENLFYLLWVTHRLYP